MKSTLLATALACTFTFPISAAMAYDGTITFTGEISNTTCNVSVNGRNSSTEIKFSPISVSSLSKPGEVANEMPITLSLTNCVSAQDNVRAIFESPETDMSTGNLKNKGTASNVQVQLLDKGHSAIKLGDEDQSSGPSFSIVNDMATLNYFARYYATDKVTGGNVDTLVNYSLSYF